MCTVSWFADGSGYELFFNRDEQKSRSLAQPPRQTQLGAQQSAVWPLDPEGGGSWIALNNGGICVALLNYYQGVNPKFEGENHVKPVSRGKLILQLAECCDAKAVERYLIEHDLGAYQPFTLLVIEPGESGRSHSSKLKKAEGQLFQWDGKHLSAGEAPRMISSSSVRFDEVIASRNARYRAFSDYLTAPIKDRMQAQVASVMFHRDHIPEASELSVCMHREDASTVSLTHINVTQKEASMTYMPGSPCTDNPTYHTETMIRSSAT